MGLPITDPDELNSGTEIVISTSGKTIRLVVTGNLSTDGVTLKCVYSKLKELWMTSDLYITIDFPMLPITDEQFEMINGWNWFDNTTRYLIRTGGWAVKNTANISSEEWTGIISLGSIGATEQPYYQHELGDTTNNFQLQGVVNQAVQTYSLGVFDYRDYFKIYTRTYLKTYAFSQLSDIGTSTLSYQVYRFPLSNNVDNKITHDDATVSTTLPYTGMSITWYAAPQTRLIGGVSYDFHVIIDGNNGTVEQIYEYVHYQLRQNTDIDSGAGNHIGLVTTNIVRFFGEILYTQLAMEGGVFIDNYRAEDTNRIVFTDDLGVERSFPFVTSITLNFSPDLVTDTSSKYFVYFTAVPSGSYGTSSGILVNDIYSVPMSGYINGNTTISNAFAYDTNNQGGRTPGVDVGITALAIGTSGAQFALSETTVVRSSTNSIVLSSNIERNYQV
jgi:hypothetical protein